MTVSEQVIQVLDKLCEKFGMAIDWTNENVIPYVKELGIKLVNWEIMTSIFLGIVYIIILAAIVIIATFFIKGGKKTDWNDFYMGGTIISAIVGAPALIIFVCLLCSEIFDIITALTFPELTIIGYIKDLLPPTS